MQTMKMTVKITGREHADNYFDVKFKVLLTVDSTHSTRRRSISGLVYALVSCKTEPYGGFLRKRYSIC